MTPPAVVLRSSRRGSTATRRLAALTLAVVATTASGRAQEVVEFAAGGTSPVDTAWGNFQVGLDDVVVCQEFSFSHADALAVQLVDYRLAVTSPAGLLGGGAVTMTIHAIADGAPGPAILTAPFEIGGPAPAYPQAIDLAIPGLGSAVTSTVPTNTPLFTCVRTANPTLHLGGFFRSGFSVLCSYDGGTRFQEQPNASLGLRISGLTQPVQAGCEGDRLVQGGAGPGSNQAVFDTVATIFNAGAETRDFALFLSPREGGPPRLLREIELASRSLRDIRVSELLGGDAGFGSLYLDCLSRGPKSGHEEGLMMQATVFATLPGGEEYGQLFTAQEPDAAQVAGATTLLFTTHDPTRYRVNVGVTAVADGTAVTLTPLAADGSPLAAGRSFTFDHGGNTQVNDLHASFALGPKPNVMVEVEVTAGAAFSYVSVLDGTAAGLGTSDPTTILPVGGGAEVVRLLELGAIHGVNEFAGSAMVHNHANRLVTVEATFFARATPGHVASASFSLGAHETRGWDDLVGDLFGLADQLGTVVLRATGNGRISAVGREYAVFRDAAGAVVGTAGQDMPGLGEGELLRSGFDYHFLGLAEGSGNAGEERSHLAAFNPGSADVTLQLTAFDFAGQQQGTTVERSVRGQELIRLNRVLELLGAAAGEESKRLVVTVDGPVHVLAYRVNRSGDPVTLTPFSTPSE